MKIAPLVLSTSFFLNTMASTIDQKQINNSHFISSVRTKQLVYKTVQKSQKNLNLSPLNYNASESSMLKMKNDHKNFMGQYEKTKKDVAVQKAIFEGVNFTGTTLLTFAVGAAAAPITGGASLLAAASLAGLTVSYSQIMSAATEGVKENGVKRMEKVLLHKLNQMQENNEIEVEEITGMSLEDFDNVLYPNEENFDQEFEAVDSEHKSVINAMKIEALRNIQRKADLRNAIAQANNQTEIEKNRNSIIEVSQELTNYISTTENSISSIIDAQASMESTLTELQEKVSENTQDIRTNKSHIDFIENFMYSKMSPKEQLTFLNSGLAGLNGEQLEIEKLKIKAVQEKQDFIRGMNKFIQGSDKILNIAANLGLEGEFFETAGEAVNMAGAGFSAIMSFSSGTPMGIIDGLNTVSGLFGKKQDAGAQRHKQIMGALKSLLKGQQIMNEKLDAILSNQASIIKNQQEILKQVLELRQQVQNNHEVILDNLNDIHYSIYKNQQILSEIIEDNLNQCQTFLDNRNSILEMDETYYSSYEGLQDFVSIPLVYSSYENCLEGIGKQIQDKNGISHIFKLHNATFIDNQQYEVTHVNNYSNMMSVIKNNWGLVNSNINSANELYIATSLPSLTIKDMVKKNKDIRISNTAAQRVESYIHGKTETSLSELLSTFQIQKYSQTIIDILPFLEVIDKNSEIIGLEKLLSKKRLPPTALFTLQHGLLPIVDTAISQQNILAGDYFIPLAYEIIKSYYQSPAEYKRDFTTIIKTLETNDLLKRNFAKYYAHQEVKGRLMTYKLISNDEYMAKLKIKNHEGLKIIDKKISVQLGDFELELPSYVALKENQMEKTWQLERLYKIKAILVDELASYKVQQELKKTSSGELLNTLLKNASLTSK